MNSRTKAEQAGRDAFVQCARRARVPLTAVHMAATESYAWRGRALTGGPDWFLVIPLPFSELRGAA